MRLLLTLGVLAWATPLAAQTHPSLPAPHAAPLLWVSPAGSLAYPQDTVRATTGAGTGTWVGAALGGVGGYLVASLCEIGDQPCGTTKLIGLALGAFTGAMIGSALEGDQH